MLRARQAAFSGLPSSNLFPLGGRPARRCFHESSQVGVCFIIRIEIDAEGLVSGKKSEEHVIICVDQSGPGVQRRAPGPAIGDGTIRQFDIVEIQSCDMCSLMVQTSRHNFIMEYVM